MPATDWENLSDFLSLDDFATTATFTTTGGTILPSVAGIFDEPYFNAEAGEYDMATGEPRFTCNWADVAALKKNDECVIGGVKYTLDHPPYPDGTGMAVLKLSRDFAP